MHKYDADFSEFADASPLLMWMSDASGQRRVNLAYLEFIGADESAMGGDEWAHFIHPDDRESCLDAYRNATALHEPFELQFRFRRADGVYRWMKTVGVPRIYDGEFCGYLAYKVDITDLKEAEQELREADRDKNIFFAMLAHELRTPLAAIRNAVQVIGHERSTAELAARSKSVIERQTTQMVRMVDDLLDLSRLTRATFHLRKQRIDLLDALRAAIDATAHEREANAHQLALDIPKQPIHIEADAARLQQVFANLLSNAARYTPRGGHVWISVEVQQSHERNSTAAHFGARASVRVRDDGIGIDPESLANVFNLFSRIESRGAGLGIGLSLASRLVKLHGGAISAFSAGRDKGSEFMLRLPIIDVARESVPASTQRESPSATPLRVLVVDDSPDAANMLVQLLQLAQHDVRAANDGRTALRIASEFTPQIVLLDISMPEMNGVEVAQRLRADPGTAHAFIAAVTGLASNEMDLDLSPNGFNERITKPLENDELLALLARATRTVARAKG
ncbi:MAG: response regulator [Gammaproteobacteria bacterium]|nr:MAG: response regulator [Gammaproteobacteria bacterium]